MELEAAMIYANALYGAASDLGHVSEVREEITEISRLTRDEEEFSKMLTNPGMPKDKKKEMLKAVFGGKVHQEVMNFLCILVDKGRIHGFHTMVRQYCKIDDEMHASSDGVIYSAAKLSDKQMAKFEEEAGKLLRKKVTLRNKVDPRLIGGIKLFVDGKVVDASLASRLEALNDKIRNS
jgi:ATP synthase F1 delta subunit